MSLVTGMNWPLIKMMYNEDSQTGLLVCFSAVYKMNRNRPLEVYTLHVSRIWF